jgi:hypothetical protein
MTHADYQHHLNAFFESRADDPLLAQAQAACDRELTILANLDLTPAQTLLDSCYSPVKRRTPRDPLCMLRLLLLMLLHGVTSVTRWVDTLRSSPLLAALTGFDPDDVPGVGTIYDFKNRLVNGPYRKPCEHVTRAADDLKRRHIRHLKDKTDDRHDYPPVYHSQSEALAADLLAHADEPRPQSFETIMEDLLALTGMLPSIEAGLFESLDQLAVSGDGSDLECAASPHGTPTCDCSPEDRMAKRCPHPRQYTSGTAQWCFSTGKTRYHFGDRYYHLSVHIPGHDLPLLTVMGEGNEADFTLSLTALDDLLKLNQERALGLTFETFAGDMHHDTYAFHDYLADKGIKPVIPLRDDANATSLPHLEGRPELTLDPDGTPRCPGGCPMRWHHYDKRKHTHVYTCPAKRLTHRNGKAVYVFHPEECPNGGDCCPTSTMGPFVYLKPEDDRRFYPEIPRDSKCFTTLYTERTSTERLNAVNDTYRLDRRSRNAAYGLIYLTLANILEHAVVRRLEQVKRVGSEQALLRQTLASLAQA